MNFKTVICPTGQDEWKVYFLSNYLRLKNTVTFLYYLYEIIFRKLK